MQRGRVPVQSGRMRSIFYKWSRIVKFCLNAFYHSSIIQSDLVLLLYCKCALNSRVQKQEYSLGQYHVCSWWRHQMKHFPRYWPFVRGIHRSPVNSPHKGQWRRALMFYLICARVNGWVNNCEAGDLRRHRGHYDVKVMWCSSFFRHQVIRRDNTDMKYGRHWEWILIITGVSLSTSEKI